MSQQDLFSTVKLTHYTPTPAPKELNMPNWKRISVCGVETSVRDIDAPDGSSDLQWVTCPECLRRAGK